MTQYLVAIYRPDDYAPSVEAEGMSREIDVLNDKMVTAGARKFGGLSPPAGRGRCGAPDGKVLVTDGSYTETEAHTGGFWMLEAADLNEALGTEGCHRLLCVGRGARD